MEGEWAFLAEEAAFPADDMTIKQRWARADKKTVAAVAVLIGGIGLFVWAAYAKKKQDAEGPDEDAQAVCAALIPPPFNGLCYL